MYRVHFVLSAGQEINHDTLTISAISGAIPDVTGAVLATPLAESPPGLPAPTAAGVLDLWFDSLAAADAATTATLPAGLQADHVLLGIERVVMRTPDFYHGECIKGVYLFSRKAGMTMADFQRHWWYVHGPIAALTEEATCYVQSHIQREAAFDGVTELYWRDVDADMRGISSEQMRVDQAGDAENFVEPGSVELMIAEQHIILPPWSHGL